MTHLTFSSNVSLPERLALARDFVKKLLTPREQMVVAAFLVGLNQAELARAWHVSRPRVSRIVRQIRLKADRYWS